VKSDVEIWLKKDGEEFLKAIGVEKGQIVLDFGCGEGHYSIPAAKVVGERGRIYALDKDKQALNQLIKLIKNINIKNIEVMKKESKTSLEDNFVDFILCYDVVHYVKNRKIIYHEFYRVLRPKGIFSLYPKHHKNDSPLMELAHMKLEDIIKEVEEAGFSFQDKFLIRLIHDDYYNEGYILNFRKN
jgi:ubiquinone/menaquinone biosynthesis C-methylase UbiE